MTTNPNGRRQTSCLCKRQDFREKLKREKDSFPVQVHMQIIACSFWSRRKMEDKKWQPVASSNQRGEFTELSLEILLQICSENFLLTSVWTLGTLTRTRRVQATPLRRKAKQAGVFGFSRKNVSFAERAPDRKWTVCITGSGRFVAILEISACKTNLKLGDRIRCKRRMLGAERSEVRRSLSKGCELQHLFLVVNGAFSWWKARSASRPEAIPLDYFRMNSHRFVERCPRFNSAQ